MEMNDFLSETKSFIIEVVKILNGGCFLLWTHLKNMDYQAITIGIQIVLGLVSLFLALPKIIKTNHWLRDWFSGKPVKKGDDSKTD
jgi:hypothetical protein